MTPGKRATKPAQTQNDLLDSIHRILLGTKQPGNRLFSVLLLAIGVFTVNFTAYALGVFGTSGGTVFVPFHAALVGAIVAFWVGYSQNGLLLGWMFTFLSFLGRRAEWGAYEISSHSLAERLAYFVRPDGLLFLAVIGLVVGTVAFVLGYIVRRGVDTVRSGSQTATT